MRPFSELPAMVAIDKFVHPFFDNDQYHILRRNSEKTTDQQQDKFYHIMLHGVYTPGHFVFQKIHSISK
jgi:hypothetical protein